MNQNEQFNIEQMFMKYLNLVGLRAHELSPVQLTEMRRAFIGAVGQTIVLLTQELPAMSDAQGSQAMDDMMLQIKNFWDTQNLQQNG